MKIAIAGYGVEGRANYKYFADRFPDANITIVDENKLSDTPGEAEVLTGSGVFSKLADFDLVVRTPQLAPGRIKTNGKIWSGTNEFFDKCPAPIIGVTGTKGKGTTCSLITSILEVAGKKVHLLGNIGVPALEVLPRISPEDIVVFELSSFQLWDLEQSPQTAVVLMIEPDHLDVHADFDEYVSAKSNIARHQEASDLIVYHPTNQFSRQIAMLSRGRKQRYFVPEDGAVYVEANNFCVQGHAICSVGTLHIVGPHNLENACAAISVAYQFTDDHRAIEQGLSSFTGLPHRLKLVAEVNGIKYYDDSISTTPGSAIAALRSFDQPKTIILGGSDKGADYGEVIEECRQQQAQVVAIGKTGETIHELANKHGVKSYRVNGLMPEVVAQTAKVSQPGSVVLLSPASASFDQYANYIDRGEKFITAVAKLME